MTFQLYETLNPIDREQRRRINLNWTAISNRFSNLQGQVSVLAGGEDVEALINRINEGIVNSEAATAAATQATNEANQAINDVNLAKDEVEAATTEANRATQEATAATEEVQGLIDELNVRIPELTMMIADNAALVAELESLQMELTTLQTDLGFAIASAETATNNAVQAYENIRGWNGATLWDDLIPYERNNVVTFNRSTWQAKRDNLGVQPVAGDDWILLAGAGVDGTGAVSSVNGVMPDENGNVVINKATVQLGNVQNFPIATEGEAVSGASETSYMNPLRTKQAYDEFSKPILDDAANKQVTLNSGSNTINALNDSPVNVLRIEGKTIINYVPLFDSGAWALHANTVVNAPNKITHTATTVNETNVMVLAIKPNTQYTLSVIHGANSRIYAEYKNGTTYISGTGAQNDTVTFTTPSNANRLDVYLETKTVATHTFENVSLVEGAQAQPFVANVKGLTNPTIVNETNETSLVVPTTLYDGEYVEQNAKGELVKLKNTNKLELDENVGYAFANNANGFKEILIPIPNGSTEDIKIVRFNGSVLQNIGASGSILSFADTFRLAGSDLILGVDSADSGWGSSYTPTTEEIKAYFLGWRMNLFGGGTQPYNGTGEKEWHRIKQGKIISDTGVLKVPTVKNEDVKSYELIYRINKDVKEIIKPFGDLILSKGENNLNLYAGRIVNEKANAVLGGGNNLFINQSGLNESRLNYKNQKINSIYSNNEKDYLWSITEDSEGLFGRQRAFVVSGNYKYANSYSVDYEPLYTFEVTAPIDSLQLEYYESLSLVVSELNKNVANNNGVLSRVLENVVNENSITEIIKPTLLNGLKTYGTGANGYYKTKEGLVFVNLFLEGTVAAANTVIFRLPKGYRPINGMFFVHFSYIEQPTIGFFSIGSDGDVFFANGEAVGKQFHIISAVFKAER